MWFLCVATSQLPGLVTVLTEGHPHLLPHHSAAVLTDDLPDREKRNETTLLGALESC